MHNKCNALESSQNQPPTPVCGKIDFHETGPWCQKVWQLLERKKLHFEVREVWVPISATEQLHDLEEAILLSESPFLIVQMVF